MMKIEDLQVVYEDNHLIVVIKQPEIPTQADSSQDDDMLNIVKRYIKEKYNKPGNVFLGLVHRLDRRVGGLMVFARTSKAASRLSELIRNHEFYKEYLGIVAGITPPSGRLINYLNKTNEDGPMANISSLESAGQEAILEYETIARLMIDEKEYSLVKINLITGRYNQIRIQFAYFNHPILNDFKYGYRGHHDEQQMALVCSSLQFAHPITKEKQYFNYIPEEGIWKHIRSVYHE